MQLEVAREGLLEDAGKSSALHAATAAAAASSLEAQSEAEELRKQVKDLTTQKDRLKTVC